MNAGIFLWSLIAALAGVLFGFDTVVLQDDTVHPVKVDVIAAERPDHYWQLHQNRA